MVNLMIGDELKAESMAAYSFGEEQSRRQQRVAALLAKSSSIKNRR